MTDGTAENLLFREARTHKAWQSRPINDATIYALYELFKWGPTSTNCSPLRVVFVKSLEAREKLLACLPPGNVPKAASAPLTAVIGMDMAFYDKLPKLFPHADARTPFIGNTSLIESTALRNSSLQGAYLIMAARLLGLDAGPMSGFDAARVDEAFFARTAVRSNFLCNLGYGDKTALMPRGPRLLFEEACLIA